ncbi:LOW QUALITY PROTEIN: hypothetical protein V2J09_002633 [Rumex salicifolius]
MVLPVPCTDHASVGLQANERRVEVATKTSSGTMLFSTVVVLEEPPNPGNEIEVESTPVILEATDMLEDAVTRSGLLWNYRGTFKGSFERSMRYLLRKFKPDFLVLLETHVAGHKAGEICRRQRFDRFERVKAQDVYGGDFNVVRSLEERIGGSGQLSPDIAEFNEWIDRHQLIDMRFEGTPYTWARGSKTDVLVQKRLDRVLLNETSRIQWPEAYHLLKLCSDHNPLLVRFDGKPQRNHCRGPFRFQAMWLSHPNFKEVLNTNWRKEENLPNALVFAG